MSLEAVERVTSAEQKNKERKLAAEAQAKQIVADAEKNGLALLQNVRSKADEEGRELLRQAEDRAKVRSAKIMENAKKDGESLRLAAQAHLDKTAELIVERVVK